MTWLSFIATIAGLWLLTGIVSSIIMHRRGHRWFPWLLLGASFGPLVIPLLPIVIGADRRRLPRTIRSGSSGQGTVDVVAGIDGSPAAEAAVRSAVRLIGDGLRSLALVQVYDHEAKDEAPPLEDPLEACLAELGALPAGVVPELVHAFGTPAETLDAEAVARGALLVIGEQGRGFAPLGFGTVTRRIRACARTPYVVFGGLLAARPERPVPTQTLEEA